MGIIFQQLASVRFTNSSQIPCYICETGNTYEAELCHNCYAPMALAHQANAQKVRPEMLGVIGASGVGKTVYLGMLMDMLSRRTMTAQRMHMLARGAFSLTLQQSAIAALSQREFPLKTPNEPERWNWLHCQLSMVGHRKPLELIMPDMSGEALLEEVNRPYT